MQAAAGDGAALRVDHLEPDQVASLVGRIEHERGRLDLCSLVRRLLPIRPSHWPMVDSYRLSSIRTSSRSLPALSRSAPCHRPISFHPQDS